MLLTLVGILFLLVNFEMPIASTDITTFYVDVFPDFVGYLIIWFSLDKATAVNRWFKDAGVIATGMLAVTFIQFLGSISFLMPNGTGDGSVITFMLNIVNAVFSVIGPLVAALNMIFLSFLSRGLGYSCEERKKEFLSTAFLIFTVIFFALAAFAVVTLFLRNLPVQLWHISVPVGILFGIFSLIGARGIKELK